VLTEIWPALSSRTGRYLLLRTLWISFAITLVMFGYILATDYVRGQQQILDNLAQIETSYSSSLSRSLWNFDAQQVVTQMNGMLNFPGVQYVQITSRDLGELQVGTRPSHPDVTHQFALQFVNAGQQVALGQATIYGSYSDLYAELRDKALQILLIQLLKTLTISLLLLSLIHQLITRHLVSLANWASHFGLDRLDQLPDIGQRSDLPDELSSLVSAIRQMQNDLRQDIQERERAEQEVRDTRNHLSIAIENSAMGFCRYNTGTNYLEVNSHFCQQLRISQEDLLKLESPLSAIIDRIEGSAGIEQRERINQLLQGRVQRIHGEVTLRKFNEQQGIFDITIQTVSYQDNRPQEILICSIDKTREHLAIQQVQELSLSVSNRQTRENDHYQRELHLVKAAYERLKRDYERFKINHSHDSYSRFMEFLARELNPENILHPSLISQRNIAATHSGLLLIADHKQEDFDLAISLQRWVQTNRHRFREICPRIPYSLIINSNSALFLFLLDHLTHPDNLGYDPKTSRLMVSAALVQRNLQLQVTLDHPSCPRNKQAGEGYLADLCEQLIRIKNQGLMNRDNTTEQTQFTITIALDEL
jgi:PAS domain-containing protein